MHPNPVYRQTPRDLNLSFARDRGFGTLAVNGETGPLLSHIPFLVDQAGAAADFHLVRSNPIVRALAGPQAAVLAVTGAHSYVSPDWYGIADQVPTWNYVAVHLRGTIEILPEADLRPILDRLSAKFEALLAPKPQWSLARMSPEPTARMMRMIVPCRMTIEDVQGTWKLSQNKDEAVRLAAADRVAVSGIGDDLGELARLMRNLP